MESLDSKDALGTIRIADEVVEVIAGLAASEVEGVAGMSRSIVSDIANIIGRNKSHTKGVKVEVGEHEVAIDLYIIVEYGYSIPQVAANVQQAVREAIESMTGLSAVETNVHVQNVNFHSNQESKEEESRVK